MGFKESSSLMKTKIPGNLSALREHLAIGKAAEKSIPATEKPRLIFRRGRRCSSLPDAALTQLRKRLRSTFKM